MSEHEHEQSTGPVVIPVGNGVAPFVIGYRQVYKKPKIEKSARFVGLWGAAKNLFQTTAAFIHDLCFEEEKKVVEKGKSKTTYYSVQIVEPMESVPGQGCSMVAFNTGSDKPEGGLYIEISEMADRPRPQPHYPAQHFSHAAYPGHGHPGHPRHPNQPVPTAAQMREAQRRAANHEGNGGYYGQYESLVNDAYGPRPVEPLMKEVGRVGAVAEVDDDDEFVGLDDLDGEFE